MRRTGQSNCFKQELPLRTKLVIAAALLILPLAFESLGQQHQTSRTPPSESRDARKLVKFPEPMRLHTIASMREHLSTLQEISDALSRNDFDTASSLAEQRLGMSSLEAHGAAHLAPYMPEPMRDIGTQMHRAASRFAIEAQNASVSNDARPALAALSKMMQQCVACHSAYRLH